MEAFEPAGMRAPAMLPPSMQQAAPPAAVVITRGSEPGPVDVLLEVEFNNI